MRILNGIAHFKGAPKFLLLIIFYERSCHEIRSSVHVIDRPPEANCGSDQSSIGDTEKMEAYHVSLYIEMFVLTSVLR